MTEAQPTQEPIRRTRVAEYVRMSTDQQQYSIANQSASIALYAAANAMQIVRTYVDAGKSGVTIRHRIGLSELLSDVVSGKADYEAVLVYDVSRWGRFQDADESAHYEFVCRRAGIRVLYCAEPFGAEHTPLVSVLKALKRAMAGEYSRELSTKVAAGKARIGSYGFRIGGTAGYGLRRLVLVNGQAPGVLLGKGQKKSVMTDRVTLVPGPPEEHRVVQRIYRDYIHLRKSVQQIANDLNAEGVTWDGAAWTRAAVRCVLFNEKYIGNHIVGRFVQRLDKSFVNPPEKWIRCEGAFEALVPKYLFEAAQAVRAFNRKRPMAQVELLRRLHVVLRREGKLSAAIIGAAPELPSAVTVASKFGSLTQAYECVGFVPESRISHHAVGRQLKVVKQSTLAEIASVLTSLGHSFSIDRLGMLTLRNFTVETVVCRLQQPRRHKRQWRVVYQRNLTCTHVLAVRMAAGNIEVHDWLMIPRGTLAELPLFLGPRDAKALDPFRYHSTESAVLALLDLRSSP